MNIALKRNKNLYYTDDTNFIAKTAKDQQVIKVKEHREKWD